MHSPTFLCTTGSGNVGRTVGSRLKNMSFSLESLTARDSMKEMVSTNFVLRAADSANLAVFNLRVG